MIDISWFFNLVVYFSRRLLHDDVRGVGEVLNETVCVAGSCEGLTVKYILPTIIFHVLIDGFLLFAFCYQRHG